MPYSYLNFDIVVAYVVFVTLMSICANRMYAVFKDSFWKSLRCIERFMELFICPFLCMQGVEKWQVSSSQSYNHVPNVSKLYSSLSLGFYLQKERWTREGKVFLPSAGNATIPMERWLVSLGATHAGVNPEQSGGVEASGTGSPRPAVQLSERRRWVIKCSGVCRPPQIVLC